MIGLTQLEIGLYLYPSGQGPGRQQLAGCTARPGCGCSSTSLITLYSGDVVRLEVDNGMLANSDFNSFVMYLVEDHGQL